MTDSQSTTSKDTHERGVGLWGAIFIGIGGMVGGGIFAVLGTAAEVAGGGTPVAFLIAGAVAMLTAYSYAKLSVHFPSSGGTVVFVDRAFGLDLATGTLNLMLWLSYLVTIALYASAFGNYAGTFFHEQPAWLTHTLISAAILIPAVINILNASIVSKSETVIVGIKLSLLVLVVIAGFGHIDTARIAPSNWESPISLAVGGMVIFVAYEGFELIANAAEDIKSPAKTLPRAFYLCVGIVILLYVLVAMVTVGSITPDQIKKASDYALAEAARPSLGHVGFVIVSIAALLATGSAINATIYGNARLGYTLAKDRELPKPLARKVWSRPISGVLITTVLSLLLANLINIQSIAILGSAGFLLIFSAVNAACFKLASHIKANRIIAGAACLASTAALIVLLWRTYRDTPKDLLVFGGLIAIALVVELVLRMNLGKHFKIGIPHPQKEKHNPSD